MAITFIADTENGFSGTTVTVTAPAGIQDGDTLVLVIVHGYTVSGTQHPAWTLVGGPLAGSVTPMIYTRRALATDTSWVFSFPTTHVGAAWCGAYRGGILQAANVLSNAGATTTQPIYPGIIPNGLRLDVLLTRKDTAGISAHVDPAWATRRANFTGISGNMTREMSVAERPGDGLYKSDNWTMALAPSTNPLAVLIWLSEGPQPAELVSEFIGADVQPIPQAWVYKGRALSTDDTPEVP